MPETLTLREPPIPGRFEWAMEHMRNGFYVTNPALEPLGYGVCIETAGGCAVLALTHHKRQCQMPWFPTNGDILRSDWRLWETPDAD